MTTAAIALVISIVSALFAALSLGWNIYRDIALKPKLKVYCAINQIFSERGLAGAEFFCLTATNFGPGKVTINAMRVKNTSFYKKIRRKVAYGVIMHDYKFVIGDRLPKMLEVGESVNLFLKYEDSEFLGEAWTHIGVWDTFGRSHLASKREYDSVRQQWLRDFGNKQK